MNERDDGQRDSQEDGQKDGQKDSQEDGGQRPDDQALRERLDPTAYAVTREGATEPPFSGRYYHHDEPGLYRCICCGAPLFGSDAKYDSGSGWPSFYQPAADAPLDEVEDRKLGMRRTEVRCRRCEAHLGHVFPDGPRPTGLRYCINSAALDFEPEAEPEDGE